MIQVGFKEKSEWRKPGPKGNALPFMLSIFIIMLVSLHTKSSLSFKSKNKSISKHKTTNYQTVGT